MSKITKEEAIVTKIGFLLMSVGVRLELITKIADEARRDNDPRWHNLKPQIQSLQQQHQIITEFLENNKNIDFTDPPEFIQPFLDKSVMDESNLFDCSLELSNALIENPVVIKCKPGKLGAKANG